MLKYIITGCPRSGTLYSARLLTLLGINCGHEAYFDYRGLQGYKDRLNKILSIRNSIISKSQEQWVDTNHLQADSSYAAAPFLNELKDIPVLHIIRNPLKVITSLIKDFKYFKNINTKNQWEVFIYSYLPELKEIKTPIERGCQFWMKWNQMVFDSCKNRKHYVHYIEQGITPELLNFFDYSGEPPDLPNNINTKRKNDFLFTINDIPDGVIKNNFIENYNNFI